MGNFVRFLALAGLACCCWTARAQAQAAVDSGGPTQEQCLDAHEEAQSARLVGDLLSARRALRQCAATTCPSLVSRDCLSWLTDVEQQIPSVIFRATRDGTDLIEVRIREGERELARSLTGTPLELEPGVHRFSAELAGFPAQEATYVLQAGDKARVVRFDFVSPAPVPVVPAAAATTDRAPTSAETNERPIPTLTYALGGTALAAAITGGVLGSLALSERSQVDKRCAPLCTARDQRSLTGLALAADLSFVLALLSGGAAAYTYATRPSIVPAASDARSSLSMSLGRAGWAVGAGGSF